jgi:glycosyltransferase involved in cell wall biosynthesis
MVVDDGSNDRTLSIAQKFISTAVCVVTQETKGAAAARSKRFFGLERLNGRC